MSNQMKVSSKSCSYFYYKSNDLTVTFCDGFFCLIDTRSQHHFLMALLLREVERTLLLGNTLFLTTTVLAVGLSVHMTDSN